MGLALMVAHPGTNTPNGGSFRMKSKSRFAKAAAATAGTLLFAVGLAGGALAGSGHGNSGNGATTAPQTLSKADRNSGGANGKCPGGAYCSTRNGSPSQNGNGHGKAKRKPCAGCVGKADNKNPHGQYPSGSDHNRGYECDKNHGVGKGNPAHTGCTSSHNPPPSCSHGKDCKPPCDYKKGCGHCSHGCRPHCEGNNCKPPCGGNCKCEHGCTTTVTTTTPSHTTTVTTPGQTTTVTQTVTTPGQTTTVTSPPSKSKPPTKPHVPPKKRHHPHVPKPPTQAYTA